MSYEFLILEPQVDAPRLARVALREWLLRDGLSELEEDVLLAGSELVANAVMHARTTSTLSYASNEEFVEVGVLDGAPRAIVAPRDLANTGDTAQLFVRRGRGLFLVQAVAKEWGVSRTPHGKRVWACWPLRPTSDP